MAASPGFALFDTEIGRCGIAWGGRGVTGVQLPEARESATRARLRARFPGASETAPPREAQRALERIAALLRGEPSDLSEIALDMDGLPPFQRRVYEAARAIPPGETLSYGELAQRMGEDGAARAVGQALGRNPFAIVVPCHRVLAASGKTGGFTAQGGVATKLRILSIESARSGGPPPFDSRAAVAHLRRADPALARVIDSAGPFSLALDFTPSLFFALSRAIVYQQLTGRAAATIFARVCALFPRAAGGPTPEQLLRASDAKLRGAGLSGSKALSLRDLARRVRSGEVPPFDQVKDMDDAEILERLTAVRGIGRWTVEMLLIFNLGRPDILPADDFGVRKGFQLAFRRRELPARKELEKRGERWRPYRSVASWYLWRVADQAKK